MKIKGAQIRILQETSDESQKCIKSDI